MQQTSVEIVRQIHLLQRKAEEAKRKELAGVVSRIKEAISFYDLTAEDLGLGAAGKRTSRSNISNGREDAPHADAKHSNGARPAKYRDERGNVWSGRGPRPHWLRSALESGRSLQQFAVEDRADASGAKNGVANAPRRVPPKYKDEAGNTWSGRGSKPRWMVEALARGASMESMRL
ncbi:MAG: H-NS family nucleoid-associated regulatory protein [Caldimonas sp.]